MNKAPNGLLALLGFVLPSLGLAEGLLDVLQLSLNSDPGFNAAKQARMAELEAQPQARSKLFPSLKLKSRAGKGYQNVHVTWVNSNFLGSSTYNDLRLSLNLTQPLFNLANIRNLK
ncbi:MAG TPA: hypothetical protein ENK06_06895, partial [Gammaproteobacteria bacterium]|nr:hypothetical protein [Gammaproteobacteria bacterium]